MDIIIGKTSVVKKDPEKNSGYGKLKHRDRRRNKQDRRKSVRGGVIVSLSIPHDRRNHPERRRG